MRRCTLISGWLVRWHNIDYGNWSTEGHARCCATSPFYATNAQKSGVLRKHDEAGARLTRMPVVVRALRFGVFEDVKDGVELKTDSEDDEDAVAEDVSQTVRLKSFDHEPDSRRDARKTQKKEERIAAKHLTRSSSCISPSTVTSKRRHRRRRRRHRRRHHRTRRIILHGAPNRRRTDFPHSGRCALIFVSEGILVLILILVFICR